MSVITRLYCTLNFRHAGAVCEKIIQIINMKNIYDGFKNQNYSKIKLTLKRIFET